MVTIDKLWNSGDHILISSKEYNYNRDQLDRMYKISHELFDAYYGKDYYLPISASDADIYEYLVQKLIRDLVESTSGPVNQALKDA